MQAKQMQVGMTAKTKVDKRIEKNTTRNGSDGSIRVFSVVVLGSSVVVGAEVEFVMGLAVVSVVVVGGLGVVGAAAVLIQST